MDIDQQIQFFKQLNRFMVLCWRLGLGSVINSWPEVGGRIMVIGHTGRKTGRLYHTPVNYAPGVDAIYCLAGYGEQADWYRNIRANPEIELWLPDGRWIGEAELVTDPDERREWMRKVMIASGFAAYVYGINPHRLTDEEVEQVTADYRLMRVRRKSAASGPGGPGDLAWLWPYIAILLLPIWLRRRKRKRR